MAIRKFKPEVRDLTPVEVATMCTRSPVRTEREFKPKRMDNLKQELASGMWRHDMVWAVCKCKQDGKTYRVNGSHTSRMFKAHLDAGGKLPAEAWFVYVYYEVSTRQEVEDIHMTYDPKDSARTSSENNQIVYSGIRDEVGETTQKVIDNLVSGMSSGELGTDNTSESSVERAERMRREKPFVTWAIAMLKPPTKKMKDIQHINRGPVIAAMLLTFKANPTQAKRFWTMVRDGSKFDSPTWYPCDEIRKYLEHTSLYNPCGSRQSTKKNMDSAVNMTAKCLNCWNDYMLGRLSRKLVGFDFAKGEWPHTISKAVRTPVTYSAAGH